MDGMKEIVFTACTALVIGEIIYYLTPKDRVTDCIYGLVYTAVILTAVLALTKVEVQFAPITPYAPYADELDAKLAQAYLTEGEVALKETIVGALDTVHIECESIEFVLSVSETEEVSIENLVITVKHKSDVQNARNIVDALFQHKTVLEVRSEGES